MWVKEPQVPLESYNGRIYVYPNQLLDDLDMRRLYVPTKRQWSTPLPDRFLRDLAWLRRTDGAVFACLLSEFRKKKKMHVKKDSSPLLSGVISRITLDQNKACVSLEAATELWVGVVGARDWGWRTNANMFSRDQRCCFVRSFNHAGHRKFGA